MTKSYNHQKKNSGMNLIYEKFFYSNSNAVSVSDLESGKFLDINESFTRIFSFSRNEIIGKTFSELDMWMETDEKIKISDVLKKTGSIKNYEIILKDKYKNHLNLIIDADQFQTTDDSLVIIQFRDNSNLKKTENILNNFFQQNLHLHLMATLDGEIVRANGAWEKYLGYTVSEIEGNSFLNLVHPEDIESTIAKMKNLKEGITTFYFENRFQHKNGKYKLLAWSAEANTKDNIVFAIANDITERKKAEAKLVQTQKKYTALFTRNRDGYIINRGSGELVEINPAFAEMMGYPIEELLKISFWDFTPERWIEWERAIHSNKLMERGYTDLYEKEYIRKDGTIFPIQIQAFLLEESDDFETALIGAFVRDITDQRKAEVAVIESQRLSAIGEMSSAVAHDFNNALQSIFGNLELALIHLDESARAKKYLKTIKIAASDAATRVQLLQRFGGKKRQSSNYKTLNITRVINDVILQTRPIWKDNIQKEGNEINVSLELEEISPVSGNEGELRSVFYNLIKNGVEAMPSGGLLKIKSKNEKGKVKIKVSDSGVGMSNEVKSRVFQPFFSTKGFDAGRGLGLSGAYSIIQEHNGNIYVQNSIIDKGTTFVIVLNSTEFNEENKLPEKNKNIKNLKILWVDDEQSIRENGIEMLEVLGHKGDTAENGYQAVELLKNSRYDLVLTDIGMPGMNGWQLADKIFEMFNDKIKVAVLTGWGDQMDEPKMKQHNVNYLLGKPFKLDDLKNFIEKIMEDKLNN